MQKRRFSMLVLVMVLVTNLIAIAGGTIVVSAQTDMATVSGTIIHILETPADVAGNPSIASLNNSGMSCAVSFGNNMGGPDNFSMVVYSEEVGDTLVIGRMAIQWGTARSITIENGELVESTVYDYVVMARDEGDSGGEDTWSMTLWSEGQMFDGVTFSGPVTAGDLVIQPI